MFLLLDDTYSEICRGKRYICQRNVRQEDTGIEAWAIEMQKIFSFAFTRIQKVAEI